MIALNLSILAIILVLAPRLYLLLAAPVFLLVRLDVPQVAFIFMSVFKGYFLVLVIVGVIATVLYALDGGLLDAVAGMALLTTFNLIWRRGMMSRIEAMQTKIALGYAEFANRLRRLHYVGMGMNAIETVSILVLIPYLVVMP